MPRCPLCGSSHIVITLRPSRQGYCFGCDLVWGLDSPSSGEEIRNQMLADDPSRELESLTACGSV